MKKLMRLFAVIAAVAMLTVGCGSDKDDSADKGTTTTAAADGDDTTTTTEADDGGDVDEDSEVCKLAKEMESQEDLPSEEQLTKYKEIAPDEIADQVETAVDGLLAAEGDMPAFFAAYAEDDVEDAIKEVNAFENENCGTEHPPAELPPEDPSALEVDPDATRVDIEATDYDFDIPETLDAGPTSFVMTNAGDEAHFLLVVKLAEGVTLEQAMQAEDSEIDKMMVGEWESGLAAPGGEDEEILNVDLEPGNYGALCFIPGPDGTPHAMSGMAVPFSVA